MELKAGMDLVGFVKQLATAMGLPENVFAPIPNGLHLKIEALDSTKTEASIGLWRVPSAVNRPLFELRWHVNDRIFIFATTVLRPIMPLKKIIGTLSLNENSECLVNGEQASIIIYTMLKYLEIGSGLLSEVKKGWAKSLEVIV